MNSFSWLELALSLLGLGLSLVVAAMAIPRIFKKQHAERRLVSEVRHRYEEQPRVKKLVALLDQRDLYKLSDEQMKQYHSFVVETLESLSEVDRELLWDALQQPSARGRRNYLLKLLEKIRQTQEHAVPVGH